MFFLPGAVLFTINLGWALQEVNAGNTVCTSNHTDWYTSAIGETPCTTYERLRQICNGAYEVGTLTRNTPPDHCDDQVQDCCCNSISFALSMLCLACQDNTADGFDAGVGAYQQYLLKDGENTCNPRKDQNFTTLIQNAVCNTGLKIEDQLYGLFWGDGAWFYAYTRDSIIRDHAAFSNRTQTKCVTTTSSQPLSTSTSSSTKTALTTATSGGTSSGSVASNDSQIGPGAIAGIVVAAVVIIALLIILLILLLRRRRVRAAAALPEIDPYMSPVAGPASSGYGPWPPNPTSTGYMSDDDAQTGMATSAAFAAPVPQSDRKRQRQRDTHPSISNTNTSASASASGSGYTPTQGSSMAVQLDHESFAGRHTDAGPVPGADLGRSGSGRLPPAYGEQVVPVGPTVQAAESRPQVHLSYIPPGERLSLFSQLSPSSTGVRDGLEGVAMREAGTGDSGQPSMSPLRTRRKE